jgi:hypothetical protein
VWHLRSSYHSIPNRPHISGEKQRYRLVHHGWGPPSTRLHRPDLASNKQRLEQENITGERPTHSHRYRTSLEDVQVRPSPHPLQSLLAPFRKASEIAKHRHHTRRLAASLQVLDIYNIGRHLGVVGTLQMVFRKVQMLCASKLQTPDDQVSRHWKWQEVKDLASSED